MEISFDYCEMWYFFKKYVNIFIIYKIMSFMVVDIILMIVVMLM